MPRFERNLAVVIGINQYQNGINPLNTAVADAQRLSEILKEEHHYSLIHPEDNPSAILDTDATLQQLRKLFTETLPNQIKPTSQDRLLIYFAGHGITRQSSDQGPQGFLVPQDADSNDPDSMLPMRELYESLNQLECRHLLVILDCCFAGMFRWAGTRKIVVVPETIHWEHYYRFTEYPAWQVITSAAHNQEALDYLDNRGASTGGQNSPFAEALFEGLLNQKADLIPDGVITAPELYLYLRDYVEENSKERQTPGFWPLMKHDRGEYVFQLVPQEQLRLKNAPKLEKDNNPYRGLESFEEQHARFFFGRQEVIDELITHISRPDQPFTVVDGISGSGKSSLVKAGLLPQLKKEQSKIWKILPVIRPGTDPYGALAKAVCPPKTGPQKIRQVGEKFETSPKKFNKLVTNWAKQHPRKKLLLVIDQFEELITLEPKIAQDSQEQKRGWFSFLNGKQLSKHSDPKSPQLLDSKSRLQGFTELLSDAIQACPQLHLIVTLRSDFGPRFQESALKSRWSEARFVVRPMRSDELREAVLGPANEIALYFEPAKLVDRLVDEVVQMPGALPLLSFTLSELYLKLYEAWSKEGKEDRALSVDQEFDAQGGVAGLLARRANAEYDQLPDDAHRVTMQQVMLRMVELEGTEAVKRRVPRTELVYPNATKNNRVEEVLKRLDQARLIVGGDEAGEVYVEPAHDFLVRGWDRLQNWIRDEQETLALQRFLTPAAENWNKTKSDLWNGNSRLEQLREIRKSDQGWLNQLEAEFIRLSVNRRSRNARLRRLGIFAFISTVSIFAGVQYVQREDAEISSLASSADTLLNSDRQLEGLVHAVSAGKRLKRAMWASSNTRHQTLAVLQKATYGTHEKNRWSHDIDLNTVVEEVRFTPDGQTILTVSGSEIKAWTLNGNLKGSLNDLGDLHQNTKKIGAINPKDNQTVIFTDSKSLGNIITGEITLLSELINLEDREGSSWLGFLYDGNLALKDRNGTLKSVSIRGDYLGKVAEGLCNLSEDIETSAISSNGLNLATIDITGIIRLCNLETGESVSWQGDAEELALRFTTDNKILIAYSSLDQNGREATFWSFTGEKLSRLTNLPSNAEYLDFNLHHSLFSSISGNNVNLLSSQVNKRLISDLKGHTSFVTDIEFSPDNQSVVTTSEDGTIRKWNLSTRQGGDFESNIRYVYHGTENAPRDPGVNRGVNSLWFNMFPVSNTSSRADIDFFALPTSDSNISLFSKNDGSRLLSLKTPKELDGDEYVIAHRKPKVMDIDFSDNGQTIAALMSNGKVRIWNQRGEEINTLRWPSPENKFDLPRMLDLYFNTQNQPIVLAAPPELNHSASSNIYRWNLASEEIELLRDNDKAPSGHVVDIIFESEHQLIVVLLHNAIEILNMDGEQIHRLEGHNAWPTDIDFSSDRKFLISASRDSTIKIWDLEKRKELRTLRGHDSTVNSVNFGPDDQTIISGGRDGTIRIWNLEEEILSFKNPKGIVDDIDFLSDNRQHFSIATSHGTHTNTFSREVSIGGSEVFIMASNLDELLSHGCEKLKEYVESQFSQLSEEGQRFCNGIIDIEKSVINNNLSVRTE